MIKEEVLKYIVVDMLVTPDCYQGRYYRLGSKDLTAPVPKFYTGRQLSKNLYEPRYIGNDRGITMKNTQGSRQHRWIQKSLSDLKPIVLCLLIGIVPFSVMSQGGNLTTPVFPQLISQKGGWEQVESGVTQDLNSVSFVCLNRGSVAGDEGIILRTGDGGENWTTQDSGVVENFYDISYLDYAITLAVGAAGTILFTDDYGQNWTVVQTGMIGSYYSGQMITDKVGIAVGVNAIFQPFVTRTQDAWATLESTSFYIEHGSTLYEGWLSDVFFINASVGFATAVVDVPTGGAIVRTTDGGTTWETVYFSDDELFSVDFTWEGVGYVVGNHGVILQTLDGGETWSALESGVESVLYAIDFSSDARGTAVGENGVILRTENQGALWTQQTSGTALSLHSVRFITEYIGFIVGDNGLILYTSTGGYIDTEPPETTCTLDGVLDEDIYISNVTVTLSATDTISGVDTTTYKVDDGLWTTYTDPFVVSVDGNHTLRFYSIDNVGNTENEKTRQFTIQHPPDINVTITGGCAIKVTLTNNENMDLTNISWELSLDGGLIVFGRQKSGNLDIAAEEEIVLQSLVFGVGAPTITFTIASSETSIQSRLFLFFVRIR